VSTNTEIVTRGFEGFGSADMEKFTADWAPDIVFDTSGYAAWPLEQTEFRGVDEIVFVFGQFMSNVRSLEVDGLDVTELGDRHVLALYDETRREYGSAEPVTLKIGIVYRLRDCQLAHVWVFTDQERAKAFSAEVSG
jgi:ketosteroid isomerase-like protein